MKRLGGTSGWKTKVKKEGIKKKKVPHGGTFAIIA